MEVSYTIEASGDIHIKCEVSKNPVMPALPRFGLRFFLPKNYEEVTYYGYGPYEGYIDKHRASYVGLFQDTVTNMHVDYIKPQENGSHYNCSFVELAPAKKASTQPIIRVSNKNTFSFNVSHYTQEELGNKLHNFELIESEYTVLNIDYKQQGMGSAACGPSLKPQYEFNEQQFSFEFDLVFH